MNYDIPFCILHTWLPPGLGAGRRHALHSSSWLQYTPLWVVCVWYVVWVCGRYIYTWEYHNGPCHSLGVSESSTGVMGVRAGCLCTGVSVGAWAWHGCLSTGVWALVFVPGCPSEGGSMSTGDVRDSDMGANLTDANRARWNWDFRLSHREAQSLSTMTVRMVVSGLTDYRLHCWWVDMERGSVPS